MFAWDIPIESDRGTVNSVIARLYSHIIKEKAHSAALDKLTTVPLTYSPPPSQRGSSGSRVTIGVNWFNMKFDPSVTLYQYHVEITPEIKQSHNKSTTIIHLALNKYRATHIGLDCLVVFSGRDRCLYSNKALLLDHVDEVINVDFEEKIYTLSVTLLADLPFSLLLDPTVGANLILPILRGIEVFMNGSLTSSGDRVVSAGRSLYPIPSKFFQLFFPRFFLKSNSATNNS